MNAGEILDCLAAVFFSIDQIAIRCTTVAVIVAVFINACLCRRVCSFALQSIQVSVTLLVDQCVFFRKGLPGTVAWDKGVRKNPQVLDACMGGLISRNNETLSMCYC